MATMVVTMTMSMAKAMATTTVVEEQLGLKGRVRAIILYGFTPVALTHMRRRRNIPNQNCPHEPLPRSTMRMVIKMTIITMMAKTVMMMVMVMVSMMTTMVGVMLATTMAMERQ